MRTETYEGPVKHLMYSLINLDWIHVEDKD